MTIVSIGLCMMVKNEQDNILKSLNSIKNVCNDIIIYDTGSTDNTINIITNWCDKNDKKLYLKTGDFVDFSISRNVLLDYAYSIENIHYLLLLDSADELQNGNIFLKECEKYINNKNVNAFYLTQVWLSGISTTRYFNIRCIKNYCNWKYYEPVHEYIAIKDEKGNNINSEPLKLENIILFQDRNLDGGKSLSRFSRDKEILLKHHEKNPTNERTIFYLAQTYSCLSEYENSIEWYKKRTEMKGYNEEIFYSYYSIGNCMQSLNKDLYEIVPYYLKAFNFIKRIEPLVKLSKLFRLKLNDTNIAYMFIKMACQLPYTDCMLFVDDYMYKYERWHELGICSYYVKDYISGKEACLKALSFKPDSEIDKNNLKFYQDNELKGKITETDYFILKLKENSTKKFNNILNLIKVTINDFCKFYEIKNR
jgi:hypothetical protein